jgi:hypothetical protein
LGKDYILDAVQQLINANLLFPGIMVGTAALIMDVMKKYADYALLMGSETSTLATVIIWDQNSGYDFAKTQAWLSPFNSGTLPNQMPDPNPVYNDQPWYKTHQIDVSVLGSALGSNPWLPDGFYYASDILGWISYTRYALLGNYPMYFASGYKDNIYDWFHWIDDNRFRATNFLTWDLKIDLCCDDLTKLGVWGNSQNIKLGEKVSLPLPFNPTGIITEITASYDPENEEGQYIQLKGKV